MNYRQIIMMSAAALSISCAKGESGTATTQAVDSLTMAIDTVSKQVEAPVLIILDSHADTPLEWMRGAALHKESPGVQVSLPQMRRGGVGAQYLACYVKQGPLTQAGRQAARARIDQLIDLCHKQIAANDSACALAVTPDDVRRIHGEGRVAMLLGVENGYGIGLDLDVLDSYKDRGVTYVTLCHSSNNDICDSSSDKTGPKHGGLSEFGRKVVARMNALGLLVDLSHASEQTFYDVLRVSTSPVVCTHSGASAVRKHDRNLTDDQLRALAQAGGVAQVCAVDVFLNKNRKSASLDDFMAHLLHAIEVAGVDHVGVGTDFDGGGGVKGFCSAADYPAVIERLTQAGYSEEDIVKIMGGNYLRLLEQVQSQAK